MNQEILDPEQYQESLKTELIGQPDLPPLTYQEMHFVTAVAAGISVPVAATRAGVSVSCGHKWMKREDINLHYLHLKETREAQMLQEVRYSMEDAHMDIEYGKRMAANSMEWFRGVEMQMRLHGLGQEKTANPTVNINIGNLSKHEQLEVLDDDALLELAGDSFARLQPENG